MMNNVNLIGRLVQAPADKLRYSSSGVAILPFTLAVGRITGTDGSKTTDWIDCVSFQKTALNIATHLEKGSLIAVEGRVQTRSYEAQDGKKRKVCEIVVQRVQFLGRKNGSQIMDEAKENGDVWVEVSSESLEEVAL